MDSGWSWVVCGAAFLTHMLTVGFSYAIGVYYVEFLYVFNESKGTTAWISSLNYGTLCFIGPVGSLIIHRYGHRTNMFLGGIIASMGLLICSFANNFIVVLLSFGVITGLGSGLAYTSAVVVISVYFLRLRPLALGLSLAGGGIGNICFPWITSALVDRYGWRGALLITSGLLLHICIGAMLIMKPPKPLVPELVSEVNQNTKNGLEKEHYKIKPSEIKRSESVSHHTKSVLTNGNFLILLVNTTLYLFGTSVVFTHIAAFAFSKGISLALGNLLISGIGFFALIGRLVLSSLSQHPRIDTFVLYIFAVFFCGFAVVILALWTSTVGMMICTCVFGFFSAAFGPTIAECACIITGPRLFNFAYGYLMVIMGLGWLLGAPSAGVLFDVTKDYSNSFYLGGGVAMVGALVMIPVAISVRKMNNKKNNNNNKQKDQIDLKI